MCAASFLLGTLLTTPTSTIAPPHFIYLLFPASCHADTIRQISATSGLAHNNPSLQVMFAASTLPARCLSPEAAPGSPPGALRGCLQSTSAPSPAISWWDHRSSGCRSGATPQRCRGREPRENNGNHLQGRKLHLLDETLSSNKTCLDNSSFITRLFRC